MQDKSDEVTPRNFNLTSAVGFSDEARNALHAAFDAMSDLEHRDRQEQRKKQRASHREDGCGCSGVGMAKRNRRWHPRAIAGHYENADPNDGSHHGCLGGADQISQSDGELPFGDAFEAELTTRAEPGWRLATGNRGDESFSVLDTNRGAVADSLHGCDGLLDQGGRHD